MNGNRRSDKRRGERIDDRRCGIYVLIPIRDVPIYIIQNNKLLHLPRFIGTGIGDEMRGAGRGGKGGGIAAIDGITICMHKDIRSGGKELHGIGYFYIQELASARVSIEVSRMRVSHRDSS